MNSNYFIPVKQTRAKDDELHLEVMDLKLHYRTDVTGELYPAFYSGA